jgi:hypothetical protein
VSQLGIHPLTEVLKLSKRICVLLSNIDALDF